MLSLECHFWKPDGLEQLFVERAEWRKVQIVSLNYFEEIFFVCFCILINVRGKQSKPELHHIY